MNGWLEYTLSWHTWKFNDKITDEQTNSTRNLGAAYCQAARRLSNFHDSLYTKL